MKAFRVWFKDGSAVLVHGENPTIAKGKAQEIANRNRGIRPRDSWEAKRWEKEGTISKVEELA